MSEAMELIQNISPEQQAVNDLTSLASNIFDTCNVQPIAGEGGNMVRQLAGWENSELIKTTTPEGAVRFAFKQAVVISGVGTGFKNVTWQAGSSAIAHETASKSPGGPDDIVEDVDEISKIHDSLRHSFSSPEAKAPKPAGAFKVFLGRLPFAGRS